MANLGYTAGLLASVGLLLAGRGAFIRLNRYAEELELKATAAAKREDGKLRAVARARRAQPGRAARRGSPVDWDLDLDRGVF